MILRLTILCLFAIASITVRAYAFTSESSVDEDKIEAMNSGITTDLAEMSEKWYKQGQTDIALEFEQVLLQKTPENWEERAKIWNKRGELELFLRSALPPYDIEDIEAADARRDFWEGMSKPEILGKLADKWHSKGDEKQAINFDTSYILSFPERLVDVMNKWSQRNRTDIALKLFSTLLDPSTAQKEISKLKENGSIAKAQELGNKVMEYWASRDEGEDSIYLLERLEFAASMGSSYYYEMLKSRAGADSGGSSEISNYSKHVQSLPLNSIMKDLSITDYLTHRAYVSPEFLSKHNISIEKVRTMLEVDIYELAKKSDITFSILHVVALHSKEDPSSKLYLFYEFDSNSVGSSVGGYYSPESGATQVIEFPFSVKMRRTLAHEWTHQVMDILFHNIAKPYSVDNDEAQSDWKKAMNIVTGNSNEALKKLRRENPRLGINFRDTIDAANPFTQALISIKQIYTYSEDDREAEVIARFVELIGSDAYGDPRVKELMSPIYEYWMQHIQPAIQKYVKDRAAVDTFVSDWERENILDPFYRDQI